MPAGAPVPSAITFPKLATIRCASSTLATMSFFSRMSAMSSTIAMMPSSSAARR